MRRNEWALVAFTALTNTADAVTRVALPLLAVGLTDSPALVALVAVLLTLPWLLTALHVGVLVDRHNRRTLMVVAELARLASIAALLTAVTTQSLSLPMVFAVAAVLGVAEVVAMTAGASIIPAAIELDRREKANARITAVEYLCHGFVGAPIGGFLVAAGFVFALGVTGVVYLAGGLLLLALTGAFKPVRAERRPVRLEIREGLSFLWHHRLLRTMALLITVMAGCWAAWMALIPAYAMGPLRLNESQYGFLLTALGAGGVVGALVVGRVNRLLGPRRAMFADIVGSFLLVAVPALLPAGPGSAIPIAAAAFAAGLGGTMWVVNARTIYQSVVPDALQGRFHSASRLVGWGFTPIAAGLAGVVAQAVSFRAAFAVFAIACAGLVVPFLRVVTSSALTAGGATGAGDRSGGPVEVVGAGTGK